MITIEPTGEVSFRVYLPYALRVEILGSFTGWEAHPISMTPEGHGWWIATIQAPPGDWHFRYRSDGCTWTTDFAAHGVERNEYGSLNSCIRIEQRGRSRRAA